MKIETRDFGTVEVNPGEVIRFTQPLYGFEEQQDYVLLSDDSVGDCFLWLQAVGDRDTCFILVDPAVLAESYAPRLPEEMLRQLGLEDQNQAALRVVAVVHEDFAQSTVNLKSPVAINRERKLAAQVMLEEAYPVRAPLMGGKGAGSC